MSVVLALLVAVFAAAGFYYLASLHQLQTYHEQTVVELASQIPGADTIAVAEKSAANSSYRVESQYIRSATLLLLTLVGVFVIGFIVNFALVFIFSLRMIMEGIRRFQLGELSYRIPLVSKNEFGAIATYLNEAMGRIELAQKKQKLAERQLRAANQRLEGKVEERTEEVRKTEQRFRHLIENLSDLVTIVDRRGIVRYHSPSLKTLLGFEPRELVGKSVLERVHPDDRDRARAAFSARIKQNGFAPAVELRLQHKDGSWRTVEAVSNNRIDDPDISGFIVTSKDITQRKENEEKLRELDELKSVFIRTVSHQLRTPLNAVRWNLENLLSGELGELKNAQKEFVRVTYDADVEIIHRIDDLLTALDIQEGRVLLKTEAHDLGELLESVRTGLQKTFEAKRIRLTVSAPKRSLPPIPMDPEKIRVVLEKLLGNAATYTSAGGSVHLTLKREGEHAYVEVKDNGIGIPKSDQKKMFNRFFRASNASQAKPDSSGLGLSIAKFYVEQHKGKIGFESTEGKGSTFWFTLPLA